MVEDNVETLDLVIDCLLKLYALGFFWEGIMEQQESNWERYFSSIGKTVYSTAIVLAEN